MAGKRLLLAAAAVFALAQSSPAFGRPPEEAEFGAAAVIGEDIARWIRQLETEDKKIDSVALFSVNANEPFDGTFSTIIETEIMKYLARQGIHKVTTCAECKSAQVQIQGNDVVITKGAADVEAVKRAGKKLPADSLLVAEIYRTKLNLLAQATLYSNTDGSLMGAERFQVPALNFSDSSVQLLVTFGSGIPMFKGGSSSATSGLTTSLNIQLAEELGFAKGGLNLGMVSAPGNTFIHLDPTLSFRGRFGNSSLGWSLNIGVGYGMLAELKGPTVRLSYEMFLGSWAVAGLDGVYFFSPSTASTTSLSGYGGLHVGLALGR